MIKRKLSIPALLLCLCLLLAPYGALAASTSDATAPITPETECSLTVAYCRGETAFSGVEVRLYRVAEVSADFRYTLTQPFAASGLVLEGIRSSGEWDVIRSTLEAYIVAYHMAPTATALTDATGQAKFDALCTGMYLAVADRVEQGNRQYVFDAALIALPTLGADGSWQYAAAVNAKGEELPPIEPDEETTLQVLKLWRGDEQRKDRPKSIEVAIFCDGKLHQTVTLSEENNWTYSWSAKKDGSDWTVTEQNVPQGYTLTVEERNAAFVLTNTWTPTTPEPPADTPQTGDTARVWLYLLILVASGILLIVLGPIGKKPRL